MFIIIVDLISDDNSMIQLDFLWYMKKQFLYFFLSRTDYQYSFLLSNNITM